MLRLAAARGRGAELLVPGAEAVLPHPLLLQQTGVLQFDRAWDEAHLAAFLHQPADPPIVVVFLRTDTPPHQWDLG